MPAIAESISLGLPVAIHRIDRELKKLWSEGEGAMTRASMMNLAVYSEEPDSLTRNTQMRLVETAQREAKQRIVLCDLNWTRLVHFRVAFAQFFDHPSSHHHFREIESGTIVFGKNFRSTAILFVGWLAAQLGWKIRNE